MPQAIADELQSIPMSPNLSQSFGRALEFARQQSHRALLLEHVLLALTEDPEASGVLRACNVDTVRLSTDVSGYLGRLPEDTRAAAGTEPAADAELLRVLEAARQAAQQSRRGAIDGAIVLAAIVGDGKSPAAGLLKTHGMTFDEAIRTLQKASAQARSKQYAAGGARAQPAPAKEPVRTPAPPPPAAPERPPPAAEAPAAGPGQSADDILAAARARIQQRNASNAPKPEPKAAPEPPKAEPELPLMNLASFKPTAPAEPDLPPPPAAPTPGGLTARLPPMTQGPSPAPPLPGAVSQAPPEPHLPPPRFTRTAADGAAARPPPRWSDGPQRDNPGALDPSSSGMPPPARPAGGPGAANGAAAVSRRAPGDGGARPMGRPSPAPAPASRSGGQRSAAGPLMEAIPRRMRVGGAATAQVRIGRDKVESLIQLLTGGRQRIDNPIAHLLSVRLRAPDGGFEIEPANPEAQWVEAAPGQGADEPVSWRWTVTPQRRGRRRLQLMVSVRSVTRDGVGPESAPPDRTIEVAVRPNRLRRLLRSAMLLVVFGIGAGLGALSQDKLAQDIADFVSLLAKNVVGLLRTSGFLSG